MKDRIEALKEKYKNWRKELESLGAFDQANALSSMECDLTEILQDQDRYELKTTWCISTAHVSPELKESFDDEEGCPWAQVYDKETFGWYLYVPDGEKIPIMAEQSFKDILAKAKELGVSIVEIDSDGPMIDELPTYKW